MRYLLSLILPLLILFSCSDKINPYLSHGRSIDEFNTHYFNDSLQLSIIFTGDHNIEKDSIEEYLNRLEEFNADHKKLKQISFLGRGYTTTSPHYQFIFALRNKPLFKDTTQLNKSTAQSELLILQRKINDDYLIIAGFSGLDELRNMKSDLTRAIESAKYKNTYSPVAPEYPFNLISNELNKPEAGNYLRAYSDLVAKEGNYQERNEQYMYQQAYLTIASMMDGAEGFDSTENTYDLLRRPDLSALYNTNESIGTFNDEVVPKLLKIADTAQVVMFNELHWDRRHRMQVFDLLDDFKKLGYKYFAMEAISDDDNALNERGFPLLNNGFYTREPVMAQVIRKAIELGFELVPYESRGGDREIGQAKNLYNRTLAKDPTAKVLVFAGIGHIHESTEGSKYNMAGQFKTLFNINPLTIDQHRLGGSDDLLNKYERVLLSYEEMDSIANPRIVTDYYLGTRKSDNYIAQDGPLIEIDMPKVNEDVKLETLPVMTQLFIFDEYESFGMEAIPLNNHLGTKTNYSMAPGKYVWVIVNTNRDILQEEVISVPNELGANAKTN